MSQRGVLLHGQTRRGGHLACPGTHAPAHAHALDSPGVADHLLERPIHQRARRVHVRGLRRRHAQPVDELPAVPVREHPTVGEHLEGHAVEKPAHAREQRQRAPCTHALVEKDLLRRGVNRHGAVRRHPVVRGRMAAHLGRNRVPGTAGAGHELHALLGKAVEHRHVARQQRLVWRKEGVVHVGEDDAWAHVAFRSVATRCDARATAHQPHRRPSRQPYPPQRRAPPAGRTRACRRPSGTPA